MEELENKIEKLIKDLRVGNNYDDYDTLEFDLLDYVVRLGEIEYQYYQDKLEHDKVFDINLTAIRWDHKSEASATRAVQYDMLEPILKLGIKKNEIEKRDKKYKWYIRIANHINSRFIKWMADEKRQKSVENRQ